MFRVPEGRLRLRVAGPFQSSLRDYGQVYLNDLPGDKSLGYCHAPLRGKNQHRKAVGEGNLHE